MIRSKNLLVICDRYPHSKDSFSGVFVYHRVNELKRYFESVMVISLTPYTPKILSPFLQPRRRMDSVATDYNYENVQVRFAKHIVIPYEPLKRYRGKFAYSAAIKILKKTEFKPDILHAHFIWPSGYVGMNISKEYNIPFVVTAHGHDVYEIPFKNKFYNKITKKILEYADIIVTPSNTNKNILVNKLGSTPDKIKIIYNGFDPKIFHPLEKDICRKELSLPYHKKIIVSVGNLNPIKGHAYLVKSMKKVVNTFPKVECYIIGQGSEKAKLEKEIKEYGLKNNVFLVGPQEHKMIPLWMNAADIFVLPSINEGNPTVIFEALGCGTPVIGTGVGGVPEIIRDERLGIIVPPKNSDALAEGIMKALEYNWDLNYISKYAERFTWQNIAKQILNLYYDLNTRV